MFEDNVATEAVAEKPEERVKDSCRVETRLSPVHLIKGSVHSVKGTL